MESIPIIVDMSDEEVAVEVGMDIPDIPAIPDIPDMAMVAVADADAEVDIAIPDMSMFEEVCLCVLMMECIS